MKIDIGKTYEIIPHNRFQHALHGTVQKVYDNAVLVKVCHVHQDEEEMITDSNNQIIVSKKYLSKQIKTKETKETKHMKFNLNTATLLISGNFGVKAEECLTISKSGLALSGPVVQRLNKPEWVQLYLDEQNKALFVLPCEATAEGARSCVSPKANKKTGYRKSWNGHVLRKAAEVGGFNIETDVYHVKPEEVEGHPNALGFDLTKAVKVNG
ncbi:hypothetical protein ACMUVS_000676 [Enterococcus faecalis]|nr:hypothetical protein [Enterococcus faecalis]EGO2729433.1 hypothetical protein [Enterococcus faecalis]EGO7662700.1 hypothetical protein [Enterococcus faecalis]EHE8185433.1 hypothetical protein [Enterococcus faecalis]ELU8994687.1 hypothetical protein [Enterococcus faecalis]ELY8285954.1 hypothetical protein [Enterococcus faecalis]